MRRVGFNPNYKTGQITICEDDNVPRAIPAEIFPYETNLPTVEFEEDEEAEKNAADAACQILLDEQKNFNL